MQPDTPDSIEQNATMPQPEPAFSRDSQYYAQQLIDVLQKRNRFMGGMLALLLLLTIAAAFGAFKFYLDSQSATQDVARLQSEEGGLRQSVEQLQQTLDSLEAKNNELTETAALTEKQLTASSSKLVTTNQMVEALKTNLDLVKAQNEQLQHENTIIRSALDTTAAGKEKTLSLIDEKEKKMKKQMEQLALNKKQNAELKKEVANRKRAFDALTKRYQNIKGDIFALEQTLNQSNEQLLSKNKELKRLRALSVEQKSEIDRLKKEYESLQTSLKSAVQPVTSKTAASQPNIAPQPISAPDADKSATAEKKPKVAPLTSGDSNTLDVPDQIILDLN
ncbi:hypothetical protein [Alkalimarinus sediminis]|uniref:Uncharacterized protein n=1 Tax=Alkalimarinus sediminis TaxID=1632866 RepID=A0A9E8KN44_9ALTE|nr:hypothetical protein [Alkalimarinus sediminis]UZW73339.1 hypothetical protein NNL22_09760 [Alkalimarinus sediminis]